MQPKISIQSSLTRCKSLFLTLALSCSLPAAALNEYGEMTAEDVNDMALIWIGGHARTEWNKAAFTPYVMHTFQDGRRTWFFDGFLMIEGQLEELDSNGKLVQKFSLGESNDFPANKEHWEYILDKQLGLIDGTGCKALDETIGELMPLLGKPATKHKVVMMQCIPKGFAGNWGEIDGYRINFASVSDKIMAMKWYTDLVIKKFAECNFQNIVLDGIYWLREAVDDAEVPLVKGMTPYYKEKGLKSYWIPWLHAGNYANWKELGFDMTYEQPGYFFSTDRPYERLEQACDDAWEYDFGIELEFEGCAITGYDDKRVEFVQSNAAMYDNSPVFHQRFVDYIDILEKELIFDTKQMSYYCGYQAVYDFARSTNPKDKAVMDRLASILENRHITSGWYIPENAGITDTQTDGKVIVSAEEGSIRVIQSNPAAVTVHTSDGKTVYSAAHAEGSAFISCVPGFYIVRVGDSVHKVIVR